MKEMTFAEKVRHSYNDTQKEFATRINTSQSTIESWESGQKPSTLAKQLLQYADKYKMTLHPTVSEDFAKLSFCEQVKTLISNFNDTQRSFAKRLGVDEHRVGSWVKKDICSPITQRYIYEVAAYPERFQTTPTAYKQ